MSFRDRMFGPKDPRTAGQQVRDMWNWANGRPICPKCGQQQQQPDTPQCDQCGINVININQG
jgi:ribosomal protein L37AE/L43A